MEYMGLCLALQQVNLATLSHEEHKEVIKFVINKVNKRVQVIAGSGSNSTSEAIELTRFAKEAGADGALLITPYYNKPMQEGLFRHFKLIAESVNIPIVLYNVPGRTSVNMLPETINRLKNIENIVAIKEACGNIAQIQEIIEFSGDKITVLSGDDPLYYPILAIGGKGIISVLSNIIPGDMVKVYNYFEQKEFTKALDLYYKFYYLTRSMFYETSPIPVKTSLKYMGMINGEFRLPLCELSKVNEEKLVSDLKRYKLI